MPLYSLKTSEKQRFSDVFRGCKRGKWHEMVDPFCTNAPIYFRVFHYSATISVEYWKVLK